MNDGAVWAVRLALASTAVLLVPGISVLVAWRPRPRLSVIEAISLGCGVSFGLVQLLTIVAMLLHRSLGEMLAVLGVVTVLHLAVFVARRRRMRITATRGEWLLLASFGVVAAGAYLRGSPFGDVEDYIHIALVRRLISLPHPALADIYFIPPVIYTYPFPATHYAMALVAQVGGLDPLFLYHKFRGFLVFPALAAVYAFTKVFCGSRRIALVAAFTAVAFVVNGTFGRVGGLFWGGLAPFSHTSDIAMAVLLPTQLAVCGHFLRARGLRAEAFFGSTAVLLTTVLMISHTREVVQLLVYLASSVFAFMLVGVSRRVQRHAWALVVLSTALVVLSVRWHAATVTAVTGLVASMRPDLAKLIEGEGMRMLAGNPDSVLGPYIRSFALLFHGWTPLALLAGPAVLYAHRRRRLAVSFMGASGVPYLLIIRVPLLGAAYIWGTYFEILFTPVRNVIFFVYVLCGVAIYTIASRAARLPPLAPTKNVS